MLSKSVRDHSPLIAAPVAVPVSREDSEKTGAFLRRVLKVMQVDEASHHAACIGVKAGENVREVTAADGRLQVDLLSYRQSLQKTRLTVRSSRHCFLQIAHAYYPYLRVTVDGEEVHCFPAALELVGLRLPEGDHVIQIEPAMSKARVILVIACLTAALGMMLFPSIKRQR